MQVIRLAVIISATTDLSLVIDVDYLVDSGTPDHEETFVMDTLGNRTGDQTLTDGTVDFTVQLSTNRYTSIGGTGVSHDAAGNMEEHTRNSTKYHYEYDYENRVVLIKEETAPETWAVVAEMDYDALGRRIRVQKDYVSSAPTVVTLFYYNPEWQVLAEYNGSNELQRYYVYGNYIDEPLVMHRESDDEDYYYAQDHLFSVVALIDDGGSVVERYEYDAYGTVHIMDAGYNTRTVSSYGNPYMFTGRRLDVLDNGNLLSQHSRHRTYDTYTARFLQYDPSGYVDGMNLYEYARANPLGYRDPLGRKCVYTGESRVSDYTYTKFLPDVSQIVDKDFDPSLTDCIKMFLEGQNIQMTKYVCACRQKCCGTKFVMKTEMCYIAGLVLCPC